MPRATGKVPSRTRRKKILAKAKGYRASRHALIAQARQTVMRSLAYAYRDRRVRRREFRKLWIIRINAAARACGISYSQLMHKLSLANIEIDRKVLADMAVREPDTFRKLVETVTAAAA
jgi:large subunit ribosomal protein L20